MVLADAVPVVVGVVGVGVMGGYVGVGLDFRLELGGGGGFVRGLGVCVCVGVVVIVIVRCIGVVGIVGVAIVIVVVRPRRRRRRLLLFMSLLRFIPFGLENVLPIPISISQLPSTHNNEKGGSKMTPTLILRNAFFCFSPVNVAEVLCTMR